MKRKKEKREKKRSWTLQKIVRKGSIDISWRRRENWAVRWVAGGQGPTTETRANRRGSSRLWYCTRDMLEFQVAASFYSVSLRPDYHESRDDQHEVGEISLLVENCGAYLWNSRFKLEWRSSVRFYGENIFHCFVDNDRHCSTEKKKKRFTSLLRDRMIAFVKLDSRVRNWKRECVSYLFNLIRWCKFACF